MGRQKTLLTYADWRVQESMREYDFYYRRLTRLVRSMFTWSGLIDGISERFIEKSLYENGFCILYRNTAGFMQVSRATRIGYNEYEEPIGYRTISVNQGITPSQIVKAEDCVVIANDTFWDSNILVSSFFAKKLSNIEKTITSNLEHLKRPYIITCPEGMESSVEDFMTQKTNGKDFIIVKQAFLNSVQFQIIPLSIQNNVPTLEQSKKIVINEALTYYGVNNVNILKKERLTSSEGSENDEEILLGRCTMYKTRKNSCIEAKEKFGMDMDVKMSSEVYREIMDILKGGDNDGKVLNDDNGTD